MLSTRSWFIAAVLALLTALAVPAAAQRSATAPGAPAAQVEADAPAQIVALGVAKSMILRLPVEVRDVLVSNPDIADVVVRSPTLVYLLGRKVGDTNLFFFNSRGQQVRHVEVQVEMDLTSLRSSLSRLIPNERVEVVATNQSIFLRGTVASAATAENVRQIARQFVPADTQVISMLQIRGDQQVLLRVRVAEMTRQVVKDLGFTTSALFSIGSRPSRFNLSSGINNPNAFGSVAANIGFNAFEQLTSTIQALERTGLIKLLAEPNLTAVSGETASFLAGGEFPVPVPQDNNTITIIFKQFGIRLSFTPVVMSPGQMSLKIATEVSQLTDQGSVVLGGFTIPALSVRRAETTVEMPSGGSLIIAGLLQNDIRNTIQGLPGLKDIPILGSLFRSDQFQRDETELVIAVTPILVRPADPNDITFPTDGFGPGSDYDMFVLGRLHAMYRRQNTPPESASLRGPIGFILE
jgi:pilus assembly protein CpaC